MKPLSLPIQRPESANKLNILIYGLTGSGKTHMLGTALDSPDMDPMLLIDLEGGTLTLRGREVDIVRPRNWKEVLEIEQWLRFEDTKYKSVGIDSLTEMQSKLSLGTIKGELDEEGEYRNMDAPSATKIDQWGQTGDQMRKVIRMFKTLASHVDPEKRRHVIFTALEKEDKGIVMPDMQGALGAKVGGYVDVLGRLGVTEREVEDEETGEVDLVTVRYLICDQMIGKDGRKYLAKNRGNKLDTVLWEPDLAKIAQVWSPVPEPPAPTKRRSR
jgi:hypothetical protein